MLLKKYRTVNGYCCYMLLYSFLLGEVSAPVQASCTTISTLAKPALSCNLEWIGMVEDVFHMQMKLSLNAVVQLLAMLSMSLGSKVARAFPNVYKFCDVSRSVM